ncbi:MAG TPA: sterol desaturase family protein [Thermoanaerobaculia bacterium]|nr:sterol desaturase family protein [Thermoanaerobaculia bacterium]
MASHLSIAIIALVFLAITALEWRRPLRPAVEPKLRRIVRNLTVGGVAFALLTFLQAPVLTPVTLWAETNGIGLLHLIALPRAVKIVLAVILLDYTLWIWHWLNHVVPVLWRFHLVHHVDRDLDASTALRFHFGELILSVGYRALQIVVIGADVYALWIWQTILFVCILFHHSNLRLPARLDSLLVRFVVTPRMHGIHHSNVREHTDSNWSSILTVWDVLHRTLRLDVPQEQIVIGVPAYDEPRDVTIAQVLLIPFRKQRADWVRRRTLPAS